MRRNCANCGDWIEGLFRRWCEACWWMAAKSFVTTAGCGVAAWAARRLLEWLL